MTVGAQVKQCKYTLQSIEQGLLSLSIRTQEKEANKLLNEAASVVTEVIADLEERVGQLEREEPQYKGL